jgi:hypothetical protein
MFEDEDEEIMLLQESVMAMRGRLRDKDAHVPVTKRIFAHNESLNKRRNQLFGNGNTYELSIVNEVLAKHDC